MPFGDQILVETARRLNSICKGRDLVGNFGGDRFFVMFRRSDLQEQMPELQRMMQECFSKPFFIRNVRITVQASIGGCS